MEGSVLWSPCQGQRWKKLLEEVAKGALSEAALVDEARGSAKRSEALPRLRASVTQVVQKLRRLQGSGSRGRPRPKGLQDDDGNDC